MMQSIIWNSSARIERNWGMTMKYEVKGQATDMGLVKLMMECHGDKQCFEFKETLKSDMILENNYFTSEKKKSS